MPLHMQSNPFAERVAVTANWQERAFKFPTQVLLVANTSSAAGTIKFKVQDDPNGFEGGDLVAFTSLDRRVIDWVRCDRILFRSDDLNQEIYIEAWK